MRRRGKSTNFVIGSFDLSEKSGFSLLIGVYAIRITCIGGSGLRVSRLTQVMRLRKAVKKLCFHFGGASMRKSYRTSSSRVGAAAACAAILLIGRSAHATDFTW